MPRDRLAEFQNNTSPGSSASPTSASTNVTSPRSTSTTTASPSSPETVIDIIDSTVPPEDIAKMKDFFKQVDQIKTGIAAVKRKVQEIEQFHTKALTAIGGDQQAGGKTLDSLMDDASASIQDVRSKVKQLEADNKKAGADNSRLDLTSEQRIRISQHSNVTKKFIEVVTEYQDMQTKYKLKYRDRLERQYKIVKPNATADEIDQALESGNGNASGLFAQQMLQGPQHAEAKRALYDIQERHQDMIKIEKSILELHQLFLDMAVLVDAQGDMINQIETYVLSAADHTNKGVEEMKKAVKSQRRSRKRAYCILFMLLVAVVIAGIVIPKAMGKF